MSENETVADIIAEKRERADEIERDVAAKMASGEMVSDQYAREVIADLRMEADRLEAAAKREWEFPKSQSVDADKRTWKDINRVIDDLLKSSKWYYHRGDIVHGQFCRVTADRIREALKRESGNAAAKPLRNCDIFGWRDAWDKWRKENHPQNPATYKECYDSTAAFMDWYMGPVEKEGGAE